MTSNQPHIRELGAFDPGQAFGRTFFSCIHLVEGFKESPDTLPVPELLRAANAAIETLQIIAELSVESLASGVRGLVTPEQWSDFRLELEAREASMSPEEIVQRKVGLLNKLAQYTVPHEVDLDDDKD